MVEFASIIALQPGKQPFNKDGHDFHLSEKQNYPPARRRGGKAGNTNQGGVRLDAVASISRTSGQNDDGDALRNPGFQQKYADSLAHKVAEFWQRFPPEAAATAQTVALEQNSLMIAFRKLREGVLASQRCDAFALHVYESSFLLACSFDAPQHATAALAHLTQTLWPAHPPSSSIVPLAGVLFTIVNLDQPREATHRLRDFHQYLSSDDIRWTNTLARLKRSGNYTALCRHVDGEHLPGGVHGDVVGQLYGGANDIGRRTTHALFDLLRAGTRGRTWDVLRIAYRDVAMEESRNWLLRSLGLAKEAGLDEWIENKVAKGEAQQTQVNGKPRLAFVKPPRTR
ncbi:hypothetical protein BKA62DRAFT_770421 [Auriculariales sp. MPI-PUGE-AT-0066]|nr:hypothetical protein BKA62DRAFT_770421 [Auriculariales sp. MPI-PUGE-AT-0066]